MKAIADLARLLDQLLNPQPAPALQPVRSDTSNGDNRRPQGPARRG